MIKRTYNYSPAIERRLLATFYSATVEERVSGLGWYAHAAGIAFGLAGSYHVSVEQAAGVIAALSPGLEWNLNCQHAEELIRAYTLNQDIPTVGVYGHANR